MARPVGDRFNADEMPLREMAFQLDNTYNDLCFLDQMVDGDSAPALKEIFGVAIHAISEAKKCLDSAMMPKSDRVQSQEEG